MIPRVTYCTPEIASVGLTEAEARADGREIVTSELDLRAIGKANILAEGGFVKVIAEADDGPILGVHMIGPHVTDLIAEAMLATAWEASPSEVAALIHPHPSLSEGFGEAVPGARRQGAALGLRRDRGDEDRGSSPTPRSRCRRSELQHVLYLLKLARYFDERMEALYRQGRLPGRDLLGPRAGGHARRRRHAACDPDDSLFPTHRDLTAQLAKGLDLKRVMAQFWGRIDGYTRGRDGNSHIGDWQGNRTFTVMSHLPIAYPVACGAALAYQRAGDDRVAMAICGDGATSNGRWHEALNISAVYRLPVVWVVNNNQFAYSTPNRLEFPVPDDRRARRPPTGCRASGSTAATCSPSTRPRARPSTGRAPARAPR